MDIKERFYQKLQESREQLDEVSHALAKRAEHGAAEVYHRAYDQETDDRREAITKRTPEAKKKAEESGEKRKKAAKRVIRFQKYADKKKMNEEEQLNELKGKGALEKIRDYHINRRNKAKSNAERIINDIDDESPKTIHWNNEVGKHNAHGAAAERAKSLIQHRDKKKK